MLALRPNCECCDKDLPPRSAKAVIGTVESKFRIVCADSALKKAGCVAYD
jgi:hypothetical protein